MAQIDVSDLLLDPDFIDNCVLIHRTTTVNAMGENTTIESTFATVGSVQPASGKELQRIPEALRESDVRSFYIKAPIVTGGSGVYPDLIQFQGQRFQVINTLPWLNFGQGWNQGLCVMEKPSQ